MFTPETPITTHPALPDAVPLIADFHDDRNRLSYYHPLIKALPSVNTPTTKFFSINGSIDTTLRCEYREITKFMQDIASDTAFIRSDFSSAKLSREGRELTSQDPTEIKRTIGELVRNLIVTERHIGGRVAVREHIPHNTEIRYFIHNGSYEYHEQLCDDTMRDAPVSLPTSQAKTIADALPRFSWSVDFILHEDTATWYCIDMGLDGLYYNEENREWVSISEHPDPKQSPEQHVDDMPNPNRFTYQS